MKSYRYIFVGPVQFLLLFIPILAYGQGFLSIPGKDSTLKIFSESPSTKEEVAREKKSKTKKFLIDMRKEGYDIQRSWELLNKGIKLFKASRYNEAINFFDKALHVATIAPKKKHWDDLKKLSNLYTQLIVLVCEAENLLGQAERGIFYLNKFKHNEDKLEAGLVKSQTELASIGMEINIFERLYGKALKEDAPYRDIDRMYELYDELKNKLILLKEAVKRNVFSVYSMLEKAADRPPLSINKISENNEQLPIVDRLLTINEFENTFFWGPVVRQYLDNWDVIEPLKFNFIAPGDGNAACLARINVREGVYDFSYLDELIKLNTAHGYKTDIEVVIDFLPSWFINTNGEEVIIEKETSERIIPNIWHPEVVKLIEMFLSELGKHYRGNPYVLSYEIWNEPHLGTMDVDTALKNKEYSPYFWSAFKNYISEKQTNKNGLRSINNRVSPFTEYDFENFRRHSLADFLNMSVRTLKEADPTHPVMPQTVRRKGMGNRGKDEFLIGRGLWDIYSQHGCSGGKPGIEVEGNWDTLSDGTWNNLVYVYSMNRVFQKILWNDEFIYNGVEARFTKDENVLKAVVERNLWQQLVWGIKGIVFFDLDSSYQDWENFMLNKYLDYEILRPSVGVIPIVIKNANRLKHILFNTRVVTPPVIIIRSSISEILAEPPRSSYRESLKLENFLFTHKYGYFFVQEDSIIDGSEDISKYRVIFLPYTPYFKAEMGERLLEWVKEGGILISMGPAGLYDELEKRNIFLDEILKGKDLAYYSHDDKLWLMTNLGLNDTIDSLKITGEGWRWNVFKKNAPEVFRLKLGNGMVVMTTLPMNDEIKAIEEGILTILKESILEKSCDSDKGDEIELVLREDDTKDRYLFAINMNPAKKINSEIMVSGKYTDVIDLNLHLGGRVPFRYENECIYFETKLSPGEGLAFFLKGK